MLKRWKMWFKIVLALAAVAAVAAGRLRDPLVRSWWLPPPDDASEKLLAELMQPAAVELIDVPAGEAFRRLQAEFGVRIQGLEDNIASGDDWRERRVTLVAARISRLAALQYIEDQAAAKPRRLLVVAGRLEAMPPYDLETDAYSVGRLYVLKDRLADGSVIDADDFILAVTNLIEPSTWKFAHGKAGYIERAENGVVVVHWPQVHAQINELLAALEKCAAPNDDFASFAVGDSLFCGDDALEAKLAQPTRHEFWEACLLHNWAKEVSSRYAIPIILDENELQGILDARLNIRFTGRPLSEELRGSLTAMMLRCVPCGSALRITTNEGMEGCVYTRAYPLEDLRAYSPQVVESMIWFANHNSSLWGRRYILPDASTCAHAVGNCLFVRQTHAAHLECEARLAALRERLLAKGASQARENEFPHAIGLLDETVWSRPVTIYASHEPLRYVLDEMMDQANGRVRWHCRGDKDAEPWMDTPVNLNVEGAPLYLALSMLFGQSFRELNYGMDRDGTLWVYSVEFDHANSPFEYSHYAPGAYDLARLTHELSHGHVGDRLELVNGSLMDSVANLIAPTSWDEMGGYGSFQEFHRLLLVEQSIDVHEELRGYLRDLTAALTGPFHTDPTFTGPRAARKLAWWHKLRQPASIRFDDVTMDEAMEQVRRASGIPVQWTALDTNDDRRFSLDLTGHELSWCSVLQHLARTAVILDKGEKALRETHLQAFPMHITEVGVVLGPAHLTQDIDIHYGSAVRVYRVDDIPATTTTAIYGGYPFHSYEERDVFTALIKILTNVEEWSHWSRRNSLYRLEGRDARVLCVRAPERMQHAVWQVLESLRDLRNRPAAYPLEVRLLDVRDECHAPPLALPELVPFQNWVDYWNAYHTGKPPQELDAILLLQRHPELKVLVVENITVSPAHAFMPQAAAMHRFRRMIEDDANGPDEDPFAEEMSASQPFAERVLPLEITIDDPLVENDGAFVPYTAGEPLPEIVLPEPKPPVYSELAEANRRPPLYAVSAELLLQRYIGNFEIDEYAGGNPPAAEAETWFSSAPARGAKEKFARDKAANLAANFLIDYCAAYEIDGGFDRRDYGDYDQCALALLALEAAGAPWILAEGEPQVLAALQVQLLLQAQGDRWPTLAELHAADGAERVNLLEKMLDELRRAETDDNEAEAFARWHGLRLLHLWITVDLSFPEGKYVEGRLLVSEEERLLLAAAAREWAEKPSRFTHCRNLENLLDELLNSDMP